MSLEKGLPWKYKDLNFKGYSMAGLSTSIVFDGPKICFDIAQGLPYNIPSKLFCLTHLHADHGSGLAYVLSQRSLFRLPEAKIMLPKYGIEPIEKILAEWQKIDPTETKFRVHFSPATTLNNAKYKYSNKPGGLLHFLEHATTTSSSSSSSPALDEETVVCLLEIPLAGFRSEGPIQRIQHCKRPPSTRPVTSACPATSVHSRWASWPISSSCPATRWRTFATRTRSPTSC